MMIKICCLTGSIKIDNMDLSYLHTPAVETFNYTTVVRVASENARLRPNQEIFVLRELDGSRFSLTNASLYQQAAHLGRYLVSQGIKKGDIVAIMGPNTLEMVVGMLGILTAGAVVLNCTINMKTALDVRNLFQLTDAKCILVDPGNNNSLLDPVKAMLDNCNVQKDDRKEDGLIKVIFLRKTDVEGFTMTDTLHTILSQDMKKVDLPITYPDDPAIISTTSGSTGFPKTVLHSNFNVSSYPFSWTPTSVDYEIIMYNDRPFSWGGGSPILNILRSMTRVFMDVAITMGGNNADFLWQVVKEERCTDALFFTYIMQDLLGLPPAVTEDGFRLQHVATGGQIIDNFYTQITNRFCHSLIVVYGTTECIPVAWNGPVTQGENLPAGDVGRPYYGVEIRVVDAQETTVPLETVGKVQVRSPYLMKCYFGNEKLTKDVFTDDRWFRTGDVGKISKMGNLIIHGRESDAISRGTRKVYPAMLEQLVKQMESVKDVCIVPVPDKRLYEEICVCFTFSGKVTRDDVQQFCQQTLFKESTIDSLGEMPTYFLLFEEFPKLANGKTNKRAVAMEATLRLGLTEVREQVMA
ncbi:medium-chain acyl-CoA ligase ACSF2, mitochondrial-like isoform X1 [Pecten maximus]|uniref:medium-chain acyl-CoA ligase ACSF2, mitochondrial-like isoform X1 n=1 Tax=Pecten maximus TaxID=6579 RepID=UPI001457F1DD|nr:medium-chain acyl-CoA ligase ACSF2, mitochondrial-like isoform X1 [Pecten maximus]